MFSLGFLDLENAESVMEVLYEGYNVHGCVEGRESGSSCCSCCLDTCWWTHGQDTKAFISCYTNLNQKTMITVKELGDHHLDIHRNEITAKGDYLYDRRFNIYQLDKLLKLVDVQLSLTDTGSLSDIRFEKGMLKLPKFNVDDNTEPLLLNLLAYEQIHGLKNKVASYMFLMDNLIKSREDVIVLRKKRIITGWVGRDKDVVSLFNRLPRGVTFENENENGMNENVIKYCYKMRWIAKFRPTLITYVGSLWSSLALLQTFMAYAQFRQDLSKNDLCY